MGGASRSCGLLRGCGRGRGGDLGERVEARDLLADAFVQAVARLVRRTLERRREGEAVGASMALHHEAAQAEQRRAVVAAMVHAAAEAADHGPREYREQL